MTKVVYLLANGTKASTLADAIKSGQSYSVRYEEVKENKPTPVRAVANRIK